MLSGPLRKGLDSFRRAVYHLALNNLSLLIDDSAQGPKELMNKVFGKNSVL